MKKLVNTLLLGFTAAFAISAAHAQELRKVRIGWQPTANIMAQIAHALIKTDILEKNGLVGEFTAFTLGAPLNEGLVSGSVDVGFTGDMPALAAISVGAPLSIVGRQTGVRAAVMTTATSKVKSLDDLKGKILYGPTATSAFLATRKMLQDANVSPGKDIEIVNLDVTEIASALQAGRIENIFLFGPLVSLYERKSNVRIVAESNQALAVVLARDSFVKDNADTMERLLRASKQALLFCTANKALCNKWFIDSPQTKLFDLEIANEAANVDPQWRATSMKDIRISMSAQERANFSATAKSAYELKILKKEAPVAEKTDLRLADKVDAEVSTFNPQSVKVK
jgi:sulfonate transport system substrate-binding protein